MQILWVTFTLLLFGFYGYYITRADFKEHYRSEGPVVALILARGGSKGIKLKNLAKINNVTILARTITTIQQTKRFESVWVSTDHDEIKIEALAAGAKIHERAPYTATDYAPSLLGVLDFLQSHHEVGVLGLVQVTSPFLKAELLEKAVEIMSTGDYNSVFSVTRQFKLRWHNQSGEYKAANFNPAERPRRQDWEGELIENGMFYLARASIIVKLNMLQPPRVGLVEVSLKDSLEIDSPTDLKIAQILEEKQ